MSMKDLNKKLEKLLKSKISENNIIKELDEIFDEFNVRQVNSWRNLSNKTKNTLLHELVDKNYLEVVRHVISKYQLRTFFKRESDGLTPIDLAKLNEDWDMWDLLIEFDDDKTIKETYDQFAIKQQKDKMMNIVWMDLEFTSFQNPKILECAVIITDKDLNEIQRKQWVVHFDEETISELGEWHQNAFKDIDDGGNGLFKDVLASRIRKEEMEKELLDLLKCHCPEKACPLAGSSIHVDKEVLKVEMPIVHDYLHYRVIDVSSFYEMIKRWAPETGSKFSKQIASNGRDTVNHRAMNDIEWSIEMMKLFRPLLTSRKFSKERGNVSRIKDENQCSSENSNIRKSKFPLISSSIDRSKLSNDEEELLKRLEFEQRFDVGDLQLNNNDQRIYDENPHLREVFINHEQIIFNKENFTNENRKVKKSTIEIKNVREINTTEYWETRKILLSEIEFLTEFSSKENNFVIYVGAAPGIHLNYLTSLFSYMKFILFDQENFLINETNQIQIKSEHFSDKLAEEYCKKYENILFICNIKTSRNENDLDKHMNNQMKWYQILKPYASLLTFSLPHHHQRTYEYLNGEILFDLWSSKQSIQCRLIVERNAKIIQYNISEFENSIKYFHNRTRTMFYENDLDHIETEGLDHCYDCRAEIFILKNYFIQIKQINDEKQLKKSIAQLSYEISTNIYEKHRPKIINGRRSLNIIMKK
ncbi:unnamed protein product [Adineta steineri]|uniref:Exonuclease domain-containing protein n=1 Tax=Adineta steineri TaxID=433720 RepID=A0A813QGP5_9BILA|nr:unnamed protein product [Adineta steineri]CAF3487368.1 unnamed protein product [Adineta steineri]